MNLVYRTLKTSGTDSDSVQEGCSPAEFISNQLQHTCLEVSCMPSETPIGDFCCTALIHIYDNIWILYLANKYDEKCTFAVSSRFWIMWPTLSYPVNLHSQVCEERKWNISGQMRICLWFSHRATKTRSGINILLLTHTQTHVTRNTVPCYTSPHWKQDAALSHI